MTIMKSWPWTAPNNELLERVGALEEEVSGLRETIKTLQKQVEQNNKPSVFFPEFPELPRWPGF